VQIQGVGYRLAVRGIVVGSLRDPSCQQEGDQSRGDPVTFLAKHRLRYSCGWALRL